LPRPLWRPEEVVAEEVVAEGAVVEGAEGVEVEVQLLTPLALREATVALAAPLTR
jgi:hypothetical protein